MPRGTGEEEIITVERNKERKRENDKERRKEGEDEQARKSKQGRSGSDPAARRLQLPRKPALAGRPTDDPVTSTLLPPYVRLLCLPPTPLRQLS